MNEALHQIEEPKDYFTGIGKSQLPTPTDILLFLRTKKNKLQQEALQNRSHHRFVLAFNLATEGHVHVDHLSLPFNPGQALLILPYQFHHFSQLASAKLKWLFCTFELEPKTFLEPLRNRVIKLGVKTQTTLEKMLE
jgi:AraC family transcriptional regulator